MKLSNSSVHSVGVMRPVRTKGSCASSASPTISAPGPPASQGETALGEPANQAAVWAGSGSGDGWDCVGSGCAECCCCCDAPCNGVVSRCSISSRRLCSDCSWMSFFFDHARRSGLPGKRHSLPDRVQRSQGTEPEHFILRRWQ